MIKFHVQNSREDVVRSVGCSGVTVTKWNGMSDAFGGSFARSERNAKMGWVSGGRILFGK